MNYYVILLFVFLLCFSCGNKVEPSPDVEEVSIFGVWRSDHTQRSHTSQSQSNSARGYPRPSHNDYIVSIFPDGKGTIINETEMDTFTWVRADEQMPIKSIVIDLVFRTANIDLVYSDLGATLEVGANNGEVEMILIRESNLTSDFREDPFYPANNHWRLRKLEPLSDSEIELKIENYLQHVKFIFKGALDEENPRVFSTKHTKGILRIYRGDIGIAKRGEIGEDWYSYFYNEEEAIKAYDILKSKIRNRRSRVENTKNWVLDTYRILEGITNDNDSVSVVRDR